jgi:hypothetical protein
MRNKMSDKEIMLIQNEDGTFSEYDDSNDITISCENEKQCEKVVELLKRQLKPVKPIILDTLNGDIDYECPLCGRQVMADAESRNKYCGECGCKFDWSEIDT